MAIELEISLRLLLAAALGVVIGYQRERAHKPAGLRTHILICMGAAPFTVASPSSYPMRAYLKVIP